MPTNQDIVKAWAGQHKPCGRSSHGSLSFTGRILVSYSTPIANILEIGGLVLFSSVNYSVTTLGKHLNPARALVPFNRHICVVDVVPRNFAHHTANLAGMNARVAAYERKASKARGNRDSLLEQANITRRQIARYVEFFDVQQLQTVAQSAVSESVA